ncbi:MAG: CGNR zinc finger domain-containing protein [Acidobacteriaceae bacterium]
MAKITKPGSSLAGVRRAAVRGPRPAIVPPALIAHPVGGHLALDFCNTAGDHLADRPDELLGDWESFLRWGTQVGLMGSNSYFELLRHPEPLDKIIQLREAIYRVGLAAAGAHRVSKRDIEFIRERANAHRPKVELRGNACRWRPDASRAAAQLCGILSAEALSLFCSPKAARIGVCEGESCGWLFFDESRGKRRRWCDMNDCGSRAKARRYYETHKGT